MFDPLFVSIVGFMCFMMGASFVFALRMRHTTSKASQSVDEQIADIVQDAHDKRAFRLLAECDNLAL